MAKPELLRELRLLTGSLSNTDKEFWKALDFPAGIVRGIVAELNGNAQILFNMIYKSHLKNE